MKTASRKFFVLTLLFLLCIFSEEVRLQNYDADSIFLELSNRNDESITSTLFSNARIFSTVNPERTLSLAENLLNSEKAEHNSEYKLKLLSVKAECLIALSRFRAASAVLNNAVALAGSVKSDSVLSILLIQAGRSYALASLVDEAYESYQKGIEIAEKNNFEAVLTVGYTHLAILHYILKDVDKALELNKKAELIALRINDKPKLADVYIHEGILLLEKNEYKMAMDYTRRAEILYKESGDLNGLAGAYENIALLYRFLNQDLKGIEYSQKSLAIKTRLKNKTGEAASYSNIGGVYLDLNRFDEAIKYFNKAKMIRDSIHDVRGLQFIYLKLAAAYEKKGDYRRSLENYRLHKLYYDSLFSIESTNRIKEIEQASLTEKKEKEIESLKALSEKDSIIRVSLIVAILLFALSLAVTIIAYRQKQKSNRALEDFNRDLIRQREELERLNTELSSLINEKQRFFKIIAHDLRSPFFTLMSMIEIIALEKENLNKDKLNYFSNESLLLAQKIHDLLENLLSWASFDAGKIEIHPEEFDIQTQISAIIALNEPAAKKKNLTLRYSGAEGIAANTDKQVFNLVIRNLISNALKYSKPNGEIKIRVEKEPSQISVKVIDNGDGIPGDILKNLFTNKIQSVKGTDNEKGSGLGLMLCKEMSGLIGAELTAKNHEEGGAEFELRIPL